MMTSNEIAKYNRYVERLKEYVNQDWDDKGGECDALDLVIMHYRESVEMELESHGFRNIDETTNALKERRQVIVNRQTSIANENRLENINYLLVYVNDNVRFYREMFFYLADGLKYLRPLREDELLKLIDQLATKQLAWLKDSPNHEVAEMQFD